MNLHELSTAELIRRHDQAAMALNAPTSSALDKTNAAQLVQMINQELNRRGAGPAGSAGR